MAKASTNNSSAASLGFEAKLWAAADALRNNMDAAEYKHVVLGLIFLKYISDAFEQHAKLLAEKAKGADPEGPDEYRAESIFWVPPEVLWAYSKAHARQLGHMVDPTHSELTDKGFVKVAATYYLQRCLLPSRSDVAGGDRTNPGYREQSGESSLWFRDGKVMQRGADISTRISAHG
jgi:hypothetical protein